MHDSKRQPYDEMMKSHDLTPVPHMAFEAESLKDFNVGHDKRGSKIGGARPGHNTCEPHLDIHDEVKQNHITEIAIKLKHACDIQAFNHLIIAAPPETLGALRQRLGTAVLNCVIAEIDKDFTHDKSHALLAHLQDTLADTHIG